MASSDLEQDDRDTRMESSPGSSDLSDPPSEEEEDDQSAIESARRSFDGTLEVSSRPRKRRRTGHASLIQSSYQRDSSFPPDDYLSVSDDSYGEAPGSPTHDEWAIRDDAQLECLWKECDFGKAYNNDDLVQHVQNMHCATGGPKRTKYVCEWGECQKKTSNHPSGYALKAHMRSHTKEKPYYCALPECDKAFTRSDALAKHMRTVHEPEPAKGIGLTAAFLEAPTMGRKLVKPKLSNGSSQAVPLPYKEPAIKHDEEGNEIDPSSPNDNITYIPAHHPVTGQAGYMIHYPADVRFSELESSIPADRLMRVLRRQIKWAQDEHDRLEKENAELEQLQQEEWILKEVLLDGLTTSEQARAGKFRSVRITHPRINANLPAGNGNGQQANGRRRKPGPAARKRAKEIVKVEPEDNAPVLEQAPLEDDYKEESSPEALPAAGGFDGEEDPYDNYLQSLMKQYKGQPADDSDAEEAPRARNGEQEAEEEEDDEDDEEDFE